jgi:3-hydroxyisobutyrate dehydrogenase
LAEHLEVPASGLLGALEGNPLASPYALGKLTKMFEQDDRADFSLDLALKDLDLATTEAGAGVAPLAAAIAERWRGLVRTGSSGLDVSAARHGLGSEVPIRPSERWPEWITIDAMSSEPHQSVRPAS